MSGFTVRLEQGGVWGTMPVDVALEPTWFSAVALGGSERAEIQVSGSTLAVEQILQWLQRGVEIRNPENTLVWSGFISEARIKQGNRSMAASIEGLATRVQMVYTTVAADGSDEEARTAWLEDADAIYRYGVIERIETLGAETDDGALRLQETVLALRKEPAPILSSQAGSDDEGLLICAGWWKSLEWTYYQRLVGRVEFTDIGSLTHHVGWRLTSSQIGFYRKHIFHLGAQLGALLEGNLIQISGSTSNDGWRTLTKVADGEYVTFTSTSIVFESADDIRDANGGLNLIKAPEMIHVDGDGDNDGYHLIEDATPKALNVEASFNGAIVDYAAGPEITFQQGHNIEVTPYGTVEVPSATVTISKSSTIAQAWRMPAGETWALERVALRLRRVGTPAAALTVAVHSDSSGAPSGTVLASATLAASAVYTTEAWTWVLFDATWTPTADTVYWLVVSTSSYGPTDYYELTINGEDEAPEGEALVWDGSTWVSLEPDTGSLLFKVWGVVDTAVMLLDILDGNPHFVYVDALPAIGIMKNPYVDGDLTRLAVAEKLLQLGTADGARLSAMVEAEKTIVVRVVSAAQSTDLHWTTENRLVQPGSQLAETGWLPVGRFVWVDGLPVQWRERTPAVYVQRAEYDVRSGRTLLFPEGTPDPLRIERDRVSSELIV